MADLGLRQNQQSLGKREKVEKFPLPLLLTQPWLPASPCPFFTGAKPSLSSFLSLTYVRRAENAVKASSNVPTELLPSRASAALALLLSTGGVCRGLGGDKRFFLISGQVLAGQPGWLTSMPPARGGGCLSRQFGYFCRVPPA